MKNPVIRPLIMATLVCCSFTVIADAAKSNDKLYDHGSKKHNDHCLKCHTDKVYTRENRFVKSLNALGKQVVRCKDNTGAPWFDSDTDAVVHFLNEKYYKF